MKKFLMIVGAVFMTLVVLVAGTLGYVLVSGRDLDKESKAFSDSSVCAIVSNWDESQLLARATPSLVNDMNTPGGKSFFPFFKNALGQFTKFDGSQGSSNTSVIIGQPTRTTAQYVSNVEFLHGTASITINIVQQNKKWEIYGFHVNSPELVVPRPSPPS